MTIPYVINQGNPSDDIRYNNIDTTYYSSEKENMVEEIVDKIINTMYEFCSGEYGHDIKISSYEDFCDKYWKIKEIVIDGWYYVFSVYYFENNWMEWNVEEHKELIYTAYVNKYPLQ